MISRVTFAIPDEGCLDKLMWHEMYQTYANLSFIKKTIINHNLWLMVKKGDHDSIEDEKLYIL